MNILKTNTLIEIFNFILKQCRKLFVTKMDNKLYFMFNFECAHNATAQLNELSL